MSSRLVRPLSAGIAALVAAIALLAMQPRAHSQNSSDLAGLVARAQALEREVGLLEDQNAVKKLQRIYGFYTDKQLWSQAADLFAADGTIEVGARGVYVGRERVLAYL